MQRFVFNPLTGNLDLTSDGSITASASCTALESPGEWVYATRTSNDFDVRRATPTDRSKLPAIGVILSKFSDTSCLVLLFGVYHIALGPGTGPVYLSDLSTASLVPPPVGYLQILGKPISQGAFLVSPEFLVRKL